MNRKKHQDDDEGVAVGMKRAVVLCTTTTWRWRGNNNFQRMQTTGGDSLAQNKNFKECPSYFFFGFVLLFRHFVAQRKMAFGRMQSKPRRRRKYAPSLVWEIIKSPLSKLAGKIGGVKTNTGREMCQRCRKKKKEKILKKKKLKKKGRERLKTRVDLLV